MAKELTSYDSLINQSAIVERIITPQMAEAVFACNENTVNNLAPIWHKNIRENGQLFKKHGSLLEHFRGFGVNKAVIGVGAGPSFNRNKHILKQVYDLNIQFPFDDQPFIIVASNKMFKPLLEIGVYPHFVLLIDAGDALYPQLCKQIPKLAKDSFLIAGMQCSNKILRGWDRQGGHIMFYLTGGDEEKVIFEDTTGKFADEIQIQQGGNVLNTLWILIHRFLGSTVYIMTGNDLCFECSDDKEERAKSFYADGDYRLNILNKRDEAKDNLPVMGFELEQSAILDRTIMNLRKVSTSRQLWVYKTWMEVQVAIWSDNLKFQIFNASEAGISGLLAKEFIGPNLMKRNNWYLMDEILPKHWKTTTLEKACEMFVEAKRCLIQSETGNDVSAAGVLPARTDTARSIGQAIIN